MLVLIYYLFIHDNIVNGRNVLIRIGKELSSYYCRKYLI